MPNIHFLRFLLFIRTLFNTVSRAFPENVEPFSQPEKLKMSHATCYIFVQISVKLLKLKTTCRLVNVLKLVKIHFSKLNIILTKS